MQKIQNKKREVDFGDCIGTKTDVLCSEILWLFFGT